MAYYVFLLGAAIFLSVGFVHASPRESPAPPQLPNPRESTFQDREMRAVFAGYSLSVGSFTFAVPELGTLLTQNSSLPDNVDAAEYISGVGRERIAASITAISIDASQAPETAMVADLSRLADDPSLRREFLAGALLLIQDLVLRDPCEFEVIAETFPVYLSPRQDGRSRVVQEWRSTVTGEKVYYVVVGAGVDHDVAVINVAGYHADRVLERAEELASGLKPSDGSAFGVFAIIILSSSALVVAILLRWRSAVLIGKSDPLVTAAPSGEASRDRGLREQGRFAAVLVSQLEHGFTESDQTLPSRKRRRPRTLPVMALMLLVQPLMSECGSGFRDLRQLVDGRAYSRRPSAARQPLDHGLCRRIASPSR